MNSLVLNLVHIDIATDSSLHNIIFLYEFLYSLDLFVEFCLLLITLSYHTSQFLLDFISFLVSIVSDFHDVVHLSSLLLNLFIKFAVQVFKNYFFFA